MDKMEKNEKKRKDRKKQLKLRLDGWEGHRMNQTQTLTLTTLKVTKLCRVCWSAIEWRLCESVVCLHCLWKQHPSMFVSLVFTVFNWISANINGLLFMLMNLCGFSALTMNPLATLTRKTCSSSHGGFQAKIKAIILLIIWKHFQFSFEGNHISREQGCWTKTGTVWYRCQILGFYSTDKFLAFDAVCTTSLLISSRLFPLLTLYHIPPLTSSNKHADGRAAGSKKGPKSGSISKK